MAFKLKEVVFRVRCREPGCPFTSDFSIKENLMGGTQEDVDSEALKIARDQAMTKHDAIYGRKHTMLHPEVHKVAGAYEQVGAVSGHALSAPAHPEMTAGAQRFSRGEQIVAKGERATAVCEVLRGSAVNEARPGIVYRPGSVFGAAALFEHRKRMASIIAAEDGTLVAFYDMKELARKDPAKAHELYSEAMEDIFNVIAWLEKYSAGLEKKLAAAKLAGAKEAPRAAARPGARPKARPKTRPKAGKKAAARKPAAGKKAAKKSTAAKRPAKKPAKRSPSAKRRK